MADRLDAPVAHELKQFQVGSLVLRTMRPESRGWKARMTSSCLRSDRHGGG